MYQRFNKESSLSGLDAFAVWDSCENEAAHSATGDQIQKSAFCKM